MSLTQRKSNLQLLSLSPRRKKRSLWCLMPRLTCTSTSLVLSSSLMSREPPRSLLRPKQLQRSLLRGKLKRQKRKSSGKKMTSKRTAMTKRMLQVTMKTRKMLITTKVTMRVRTKMMKNFQSQPRNLQRVRRIRVRLSRRGSQSLSFYMLLLMNLRIWLPFLKRK